MHFYNPVTTYEVERSEIRFSSRHSADFITTFSSRKSASLEFMNVILLRICDKITVYRSCQSIDVVVSRRFKFKENIFIRSVEEGLGELQGEDKV
jgi:hypothetical protein